MKSKQELIDKWESAIEAAEFYGKGKEERLISYMKDFVSDLNQLDEPETLTPEWIDERIHYSTDQDAFGNIVRIEMVPAKYLQNLLVPKQELPVIPKFVAEWIEKHREHVSNVWHLMYNVSVQSDELWSWLWGGSNVDVFARAWLDGYTVEEEQKEELEE